MFNISRLESLLNTQWLGQSFLYVDELPSTNDHAKMVSAEQAAHGTVIIADHQTSGRGQRRRKWESSAGKNLTFSIIFQPKAAERLTLLTLVCAYAVREAIQEFLKISLDIKWPNDIFCDGKKICGILTETQFTGSHLDKVIVGIGLNVNQDTFESELSESATTLTAILGKYIDREQLLTSILQKIEKYYYGWSRHDNELLKQINNAILGCGRWVKLTINEIPTDEEYKFIGVNDSGAFMALNRDMDIKTFSFEQVRVLD